MDYSKSSPWQINKSEKYIYYDMCVSNIDSNLEEGSNQLQFVDRRDAAIIQKITDYKMSIVRFSLSTSNIPVMYFQTKSNSNDPDEGCYSVTLEYVDGGAVISGVPERVFFVPQDKTKSKAPASNTFKYGLSQYNEYYNIYNYENFIQMVNTTLELAFIKLQGLTAPTLDSATRPLIVWDTNSMTASIYCERDYYDITNSKHINIYFNRQLYNLFNSFPSYKFQPKSDGKHYQILTDPYGGLKCVQNPFYGPQVLIKVDQEFSTNEIWSPVSSIVFTTTCPIVSSVQSNPTVYENGHQLYLSDSNNRSQAIITDFQSSEQNYRSTLFYTPSGENRWISFLDNETSLKDIIIFCWIKDRYGFLHPFNLPTGGNCTMKILFERL